MKQRLENRVAETFPSSMSSKKETEPKPVDIYIVQTAQLLSLILRSEN